MTQEMIAGSVTREWDDEQNLITVTMQESSRKSIDTYIEYNLNALGNWDKPQTLYMIQDLSSKNITFTPYLKGRMNEISDIIKEKQVSASVAIVVGKGLTGQIIMAFGRVFAVNIPGVKQQFFTNLSDAQAWVAEERQTNA